MKGKKCIECGEMFKRRYWQEYRCYECTKEYNKEFKNRAENIAKGLAQSAVSKAVRKGELIRKPCVLCGTADPVHAHHESYDKRDWLNIVWLCVSHHKRRHNAESLEAFFKQEYSGYYDVPDWKLWDY